MSGFGIILLILAAPLLVYQGMAGPQRSQASWRLGWIVAAVGVLFVVGGLF